MRGNEEAGLLPPVVETEDGLRVTHYVDVSEQAHAMGVEERAVPVLEHVLKYHKVTNGDVQKMLGVSRATEISERINAGVERVQSDIFAGGGVRVWKNDGADVPLPSPDNDVIIVFTHFLQHFFCGGVGLRQICDWCRLLWTYRECIDRDLLLRRLQEMGIVSEWKAFAAFTVDWLGMSAEAMPLYSSDALWSRKAKRICRVVMEAGNFGYNKDNSYRSRYPLLVEKSITFSRRLVEYVRLFSIFPADAPRFFVTYVGRRVKATF